AATGTGATVSGDVTWPAVSVFSPFTIGSINFNNPLPISINYFNGVKSNGNHILNWKVTCVSTPATTIELQRSVDGTNFSSIYSIYATALRCAQPFDFTDNAPVKGINYYRLKMTDASGKVSYSSQVPLINSSKGIDIMSIAPNPVVGGRFNIRASTASSTKLNIIISDLQGRIMQRQQVNAIAGYNTIPVNVQNLSGGTYQVLVNTAEGDSKLLRFVIQ
ncbi:MAG: T9SS type A sorting domain-containing protein, partial [Ferruginibacter sp.]